MKSFLFGLYVSMHSISGIAETSGLEFQQSFEQIESEQPSGEETCQRTTSCSASATGSCSISCTYPRVASCGEVTNNNGIRYPYCNCN